MVAIDMWHSGMDNNNIVHNYMKGEQFKQKCD